MAEKKGMLVVLASSAAAAVATVAALRRTRQLQDEARAVGAHVPRGPYEAVVKRPLDAAISAVSLVALSPVLAATALAVRQKLGSPVIFKQQRPGLDGQPFDIYKFRTMTDECDPKTGELLSDEARLTDFGKWLRSTSLDELPELYNVLKGDMAIVGPRPLLMRYLSRYNERQARRQEVLPGLTGPVQVGGRNLLSWNEKFELDVGYVDNITFANDCIHVLKTFNKVVSREGVSSPDCVTMGEFMGE